MKPDTRILADNLRLLLQRAYVPVLPKPAFRDALARLFLEEAQRVNGETRRSSSPRRERSVRQQETQRPLLRFAGAAAVVVALLAGWWMVSQWKGAELSPPRDFLARGDVALFADHGPWRPAEAAERSAGIQLRSARLRVLTPEAAEPQRVLFEDWSIEVGAASELEVQQTRLGLRVRLVHGSGRAVSANEMFELEAGRARVLELEKPTPTVAARTNERGKPGVATRRPLIETQVADETLELGTVLRGRVVDAETDAPLTHFRVALLEQTNHQQFFEPEIKSYESPDGSFTWNEAPAAERLIFVYAEGYALASLGAVDLTRTSALVIRLEHGSTIRGRVVDAQTQLPLAGALVLSENDAPTQNLFFHATVQAIWLPIQATTNPDGTFELTHVSRGHHRIRASAAGYAVIWHEDVEAGARGTVDIGQLELERGGTLTGRVSREDGSPWTGAQIVVITMDQQSMVHFGLTVTGEDGRYRIENLPPMVLLAVLSRQGDTPWVRPFNATTGVETTVDFLLGTGGAQITGRVLDANGQPLRDQALGLFEAHELEQGFSDQWVATATDRDGKYVIETVQPGEYVVYLVDNSGQGLRLVGRFQVGNVAHVEHNIRLEPGSIRGIARDAETGAPVAMGFVTLERSDETDDRFGGFQTIGPDGSYSFDGVQDGVYSITAFPGNRPGTVLGHERVDGIILDKLQPDIVHDFELFQGSEALVRVVDSGGEPLGFADVFLIDENGIKLSFTRIPLTDEDGVYRARGVRPGTYRAAARLKNYRCMKKPSVQCKVGETAQAEVVMEPLLEENR